MRVTRDDVARAAGVSSAVVSYVLNDGPRPVAAPTRERVLAAIASLGYRRDSVARSLRTQRTQSIGLVLPDITLRYFGVMTQNITAAAAQRGLSVLVATSAGSLGLEREHLADLADRRVDGVILMSVDPLQKLDWAAHMGVPVLVIDRPTVTTEGAATGTTHLIEHGCQAIARVSTPAHFATARRREAGWRRSLSEGGLLEVSENLLIKTQVTEQAGYDAAIAMWEWSRRPDGVLIDTGPQAVGFLRGAADLGIHVPAELKVVVCEGGTSAEFSVPRLTSVDSPVESIAEEAVAMISAATATGELLTLDGKDFALTPRESCGH